MGWQCGACAGRLHLPALADMRFIWWQQCCVAAPTFCWLKARHAAFACYRPWKVPAPAALAALHLGARVSGPLQWAVGFKQLVKEA